MKPKTARWGSTMGYIFGHKRSLTLILGAALAGLSLASCNGSAAGGPGSAPGMPANVLPPAATWQAFPNTLTPLAAISTYPGAVNGENYLFRPKRGDYPRGGQGAIVDGTVPCLPSMSNDYHIHAFLGIVYNGKLIAVPHALGMVHPGLQVDGWTNSARCFYEIHTHDSSGIIHMEVAKFLPLSTVYYHLKDVLDVWGVPHGNDFFGPFQGPIHVFVGEVPLKQLTVSSYRAYERKPDTIPLHSHEVIWLEIGKQYFGPTQLPPVTFYMEY
jgi:hypothetical protein